MKVKFKLTPREIATLQGTNHIFVSTERVEPILLEVELDSDFDLIEFDSKWGEDGFYLRRGIKQRNGW